MARFRVANDIIERHEQVRAPMKFITPHIQQLFADRTMRSNVRALVKVIITLALAVTVFAILFHFVMLYEGKQHSWLTGVYWALTVMSTLGFGDITFHTDLGRLFSIVVLLTGIVMLLIVLPFSFIRYFYAPWLEAQIRTRAPRSVAPDVRDHVLICDYDAIAAGLIERCSQDRIPYYIVDPDPTSAYERWVDGLPVVTGEIESSATFVALGAARARLVVANREDTVNTNITLTLREVAPDTPVVAIARREESIDVLELSGATHVLPLKRWLGEQLANRVTVGRVRSHVIGEYHGLQIAELPVFGTPLVGRADWAARLHELTGAHVIGVWERGRLTPVQPETHLDERGVMMIAGTAEQLSALDAMLTGFANESEVVLVVGGGAVGEAAARALRKRGVDVHLVERDPDMCRRLKSVATRVFCGDAADYSVIEEAGVRSAPSVVLTTNDDAMNIYLASYCRSLNPQIRLVSRITHDRNTDAIHRAGADLVLSYAWLGVESILAVLEGRELVLLSEGLDLFATQTPASLRGRALGEIGLRERTGLTLLAIESDGEIKTSPAPDTKLVADMQLILIGSTLQRRKFIEQFA